jgi:hypothetical protein
LRYDDHKELLLLYRRAGISHEDKYGPVDYDDDHLALPGLFDILDQLRRCFARYSASLVSRLRCLVARLPSFGTRRHGSLNTSRSSATVVPRLIPFDAAWPRKRCARIARLRVRAALSLNRTD